MEKAQKICIYVFAKFATVIRKGIGINYNVLMLPAVLFIVLLTVSLRPDCQTVYSCFNKIHLGRGTPWRLFGLICLVGSVLWTSSILGKFVERRSVIRWWSPGQTDKTKAPDWNGIIDLLCCKAADPIDFDKSRHLLVSEPYSIRIFLSKNIILVFMGVSFIGLAHGLVLDYLLYPWSLSEMFGSSDRGYLANTSTNLTAFLALIAASISIVFTYQQLRAKVRADSRQAWIKEVRELMACNIEMMRTQIDKLDAGYSNRSLPDKNWAPFPQNQSRTLLELHLNPSEYDHRLLMLLIRASVIPERSIDNDIYLAHMLRPVLEERISSENGSINSSKKPEAGHGNSQNDLNRMQILKDLIKSYCISESKIDNSNNSLPDVNGGESRERKDIILEYRDVIVSFAIKLCHSILKREWDRVRDIE
ncbi:MAG TPA: hypothetical protein VEH84_04705 [Alphaproteobacteria bacterium]|nr:hypothetical protein [Alphaproteobacteria bacterium]